MKPTDTFVSLKQLREQFPKYIDQVAEGHSFTVLKRSKPIFKLTPIQETGEWETIADFTAIDPAGVSAEDVLKHL